jgi:lysophospholipase L1-like esterase
MARMTRTRSPRRPGLRLASRLLLVVAGLLLGASGAELLVRISSLDPLAGGALIEHEAQRQDCVRPAGHVGYELVPGQCGANAHGYRGVEYPLAKAPGTYRVLALGDSITEQQAWVRILEAKLAMATEAPVEVWNLGVTGYAVPNELAMLRHRGLALDPDLVVLQLCLNDYGVTPVMFSHEGRLVWLQVDTGSLGGVGLWLFERSAAYRWFVVQRAGRTAGGMVTEQSMAEVDRDLVELVKLCERRGIPLQVLLFPALAPMDRWSATEARTYRRFVDLLAAHHVPTVDLSEPMLAGEIDDLRRYRGKAVYADLDAQLLAWGLPAQDAALIRSLDARMLGVNKPVGPGQAKDYTHPNFLGHHLAAQALMERIEPLLP